MSHGSQSEISNIRRILLSHPKDAFIAQSKLDEYWKKFNYLDCPDFNEALDEYEQFEELLKSEIDNFEYLPSSVEAGIDSIYVRDTSIITKNGAILANMGKEDRKNEPALVGAYLEKIGVPVLGKICEDGSMEGGDIVWLDERTLVVGHGYRTNKAGIDQLRELTIDLVDEFVVVPLPHWTGVNDVMHLMSFISPIDSNLALVYSKIMPVPFRNWLLERGIELVEVPEEEFDSMGCNVLAIAPRKCIAIEGNPVTKKRLEKAGAEVLTYKGNEISAKGAGGPTCLTRPLWRE